jgi:tyrosyl-tRNA synthetase
MTSAHNSNSSSSLITPAKALPLSDAVQHALAVTKRGVDELLIESEFAQKLARSEQTGKPLRIKLGLDRLHQICILVILSF